MASWSRVVAVTGALAGAAASVTCPALGSGPCTYLRTVGGTLYSWSLEGLCRTNDDYTLADGHNHTYAFNICGNTTATCSPKWALYTSHGSAIPFWGEAPIPCDNTCIDWDTGAPACCTSNCEVLGRSEPVFSLLDAENPTTGGISLFYYGAPPDAADPFECPPSPQTSLPAERAITMLIQCDPTLSPTTLIMHNITEGPVCHMVVIATSGAACGTPSKLIT